MSSTEGPDFFANGRPIDEARTQRMVWPPSVVVVGALSTVIAALVWASRRGIDLTDESWYLVKYARPGEEWGPNQVGRIVHSMLPAASLIELRIVSVALVGATSIVLGGAIVWFWRDSLRPLQNVAPGRVLLISVVLVAGLQSFVWLPLTLSYNTLNAALVNVEAACTLVLASRAGAGRWARIRWLVATVLGLAVATQVFVKFPAAVACGLLCVVAILVLKGWRDGLMSIALVAAAAICWTVLWSAAGVVDLPILVSGLSANAGGGVHSPLNLFRKYADSFVPAHALHPVDVVFGAVAFAAPLVVWRAVPGFRRVLGWLTLGLAGALGVVAFVVRSRGHSIGLVSVWSARGRNAILVGAAAGFVLVAVFVTVRDRLRRVTSPRPPTRRVIAVIVPFLVLMPLAGAVGTGNTLVLGILICAAPWGAALVLALAWLMRREPGSGGLPIAQAALCILAVALCAQVLENVVLFPYIDRGSTTKNVASADGLPGLEGALLDPNTKTYLDSVREEVFAHTGFQPGDTVLIFEPAAAGPVLAVGGTLPESIYPLSGESNICEAWTRAADEVRSATLAFVREGAAPADLTSCVSRLRSDFPAGFVEVGSVETPEGSHLLILAPANQVH